jgi:hypothetical protein
LELTGLAQLDFTQELGLLLLFHLGLLVQNSMLLLQGAGKLLVLQVQNFNGTDSSSSLGQTSLGREKFVSNLLIIVNLCGETSRENIVIVYVNFDRERDKVKHVWEGRFGGREKQGDIPFGDLTLLKTGKLDLESSALVTDRKFEGSLGLAVVFLEAEEEFQGRELVDECGELCFAVTSQTEILGFSLLAFIEGTLLEELGHELVASLIQVSRVDGDCS